MVSDPEPYAPIVDSYSSSMIRQRTRQVIPRMYSSHMLRRRLDLRPPPLGRLAQEQMAAEEAQGRSRTSDEVPVFLRPSAPPMTAPAVMLSSGDHVESAANPVCTFPPSQDVNSSPRTRNY